MKFLVDENLPIEVAELLRQGGHDAVTIAELRMRGSKDAKVAELLKAEQRALLTLDGDFDNTLLYSPPDYFGLVVLRLQAQGKRHILAVVQDLVPKLKEEELIGKLWVVEESRVRIRG